MFEVEKRGKTSGYVTTTFSTHDEWVEEERGKRLEWAAKNGYTVYTGREDYTRHYVAVKRLHNSLEIVPLFATNWDENYFYRMRKIKVKRKFHPPLLSFKLMGVVFIPSY